MTSLELPEQDFDDGRGLYPERLSVSVPRGLRKIARRTAEIEGVPVAEFVRRALAARIEMFKHAATLDEKRNGN